jgi:hypothetical protein
MVAEARDCPCCTAALVNSHYGVFDGGCLDCCAREVVEARLETGNDSFRFKQRKNQISIR